MSGRIFQNSVLQFKETTDRTIGVIDAEGTVIACSELTAIGKRWSKYVEPIVSADGTCVALEGKCFKALPSWGNTFDYAVFATGDDSMSRTVCSMAAVALNAAKNYYEEKHDKGSFIKNIISDNILISDIYMRAKELHVDAEVARGVFVVRPVDDRLDTVPVDVVQGLFPDRQNDFVLSVGEHDVALIHQMGEDATAKDMEEVALRIEEALRADGESRVFVGIGTLALHLRDLAKSYKEAQIAIEVGKVFDTERYVINYENLGIGRLIYQLPTTLCEMFLQEVFKKNPIDALDQETLFTIYKFFENNLNVSETARKLFVHRNTLVYRLERIQVLNDIPYAFIKNYIRCDLTPGLEQYSGQSDKIGNLYRLMQAKYGVVFATGKENISTQLCSLFDSKILGTKPGMPLLYLQRTAFTTTHEVMEYAERLIRPDILNFEVTMIGAPTIDLPALKLDD